MTDEESKIRKRVANEIRRAKGLYEESWSTYAVHFEEAADVVELGYDEWARRWEAEAL